MLYFDGKKLLGRPMKSLSRNIAILSSWKLSTINCMLYFARRISTDFGRKVKLKEQTKRILPAYKNVIKTPISLEENKGKLWKAIVALCVVLSVR